MSREDEAQAAKNDYSLEKYKIKYGLYKVIAGTTIVGLASVLIPGAIEFWKFVFIEKRKAAELTIAQTNNQQEYVSQFLRTALDQDIELRIRFADYLAHVSAGDYKDDWQRYRESLKITKEQNRSEINNREAQVRVLLNIEEPSINEQIDIARIERELEWLYREVGYVAKDRSIVRSADEKSSASQLDFRIVGNSAVAPDGIAFGRAFREGIFNHGETSIAEFITSNRETLQGLSDSNLHVLRAVSANSGRLEAINTWDRAFLTFGIFAWTTGSGSGPGELPVLIGRIKQINAEAFQEYFGQYGLDITEPVGAPGDVKRAYFVLNGTKLQEPSQKETLRALEWAYRFWRAGYDPAVRRAQIEHAIDRISVFYRSDGMRLHGKFVADYVKSEYGVALLLDQHVNRPGHALQTLTKAVDELGQERGNDDPSGWGTAEEKRLLELYLEHRAQTSMTDHAARAERIRVAVNSGIVSDERGSYMP